MPNYVNLGSNDHAYDTDTGEDLGEVQKVDSYLGGPMATLADGTPAWVLNN